jgi:hypothetical protein
MVVPLAVLDMAVIAVVTLVLSLWVLLIMTVGLAVLNYMSRAQTVQSTSYDKIAVQDATV